jgi:hypothetical protein
LKIIAPRAVIVAVDHVVSAKSVNAVVPDVVGVTRVRELPLAVYPVPDISADVV